jgi:hypothetical protein
MTPIRWLRLSYRVGAVVDAAAFVQLAAASVLGRSAVLGGVPPGAPYRFAAGMAAALMLGWTALLVWADRAPLERRGVIPLTVVVVAGLAANEVGALLRGGLAVAPLAAVLALQVALLTLFVLAWAQGERTAVRRARPDRPGLDPGGAAR